MGAPGRIRRRPDSRLAEPAGGKIHLHKSGRVSQSVFREYFSEQPFVDRFASRPEHAVDVIIPIIHTNELWRVNLLSLYREIPIARLLIGDGGCIDDSLDVARQFP